MNRKKLVSLCLVLALLVTAAVGATFAYFTDTDDATNTFTVGNVDIDLVEPNWEAEGSEDAPEVYPGEALAKDPQVKNIGKNPCFVRVKVTGLDSLGNAGAITLRGLSDNWTKIGDYYYYEKVVAAVAEDGTIDATDALFTHIVMPTGLINGDGETEYDVDVFAEAVQAQGAKPSFEAVKAMTPAEIAAWFATCGL